MYFISVLITDESTEFKIQTQRAEYILSKLIDRVPDDDEEAERKELLGVDNDDDDDPNKNSRLSINHVELSSLITLRDNPLATEDSNGQESSPDEA